MVSEGLRPIVYVGSSGEISLVAQQKTPLSKEAVQALGEAVLTRVNPEKQDHIKAAHKLDRLSAEAGLLTTDGKAELLSPRRFSKLDSCGGYESQPMEAA